jgi:plasmid stabilization system protein ParE
VRVLWLLRAVDDLERIHDFIAADRPAAARAETEKVLVAVGRLGDFPSSGRPGRVPDTRELVVSSYIVAYRVRAGAVQVLRVLHASRRWPDVL